MTNCGPASESCCTSLEVTGGTYYRTYNTTESTSGPPDGGWTDEADPASISDFRLDKYLVTVGRFRQFVNAVYPYGPGGGAGWLPAKGSGIHTHLNGGLGLVNSGATSGDAGMEYETGWNVDWNYTDDLDPTDSNLGCYPGYGQVGSTWTDTAGDQENLPMACETWYEAYAFCIWDGGFLPSEAEWEHVAAGGSEQLEYPWGSTAPGTGNQYAVYGDNNGACYYPSGTLSACTGVMNIAPVGTATMGVGAWGQLDMAGEVWEWNVDSYATYVDPCTDCAYLATASYRVLRGGDFRTSRSGLLPPTRGNNPPTARSSLFGFRCARTP